MTNNRPYYTSSSFKMAVLFTALLAVAIFTLGYFSYYFSRGHFIHGTETAIESELQNLSLLQEKNLLDDYMDRLQDSNNRLYYWMDQDGRTLGGNIKALPDDVSILTEGTLIFKDTGKLYASRIHTFNNGDKILIGINIDDVTKNYTLLKWLSIISLILTTTVILISYMISLFVVSRTNRIAQTAKDIMDTGNLSQRIQIDSRWDDLSHVARVLNALLTRIENLVTNVRQVSDNIAHDLRTPLTRLRNDLEHLKTQQNPTQDQYDVLIGEADHILTMFSALLRISNIESGHHYQGQEQTDLQSVIIDVLDLYEPLAEEKNIVLTTYLKPTIITGDRDLLFQAIANLIDNAIKFTPDHGKVTAKIDHGSSAYTVSISDTGPGIMETDHNKIFQRFYRGEESRNTPGNGLGLSMVKAIMHLHKATISVKNTSPGLMVLLTFPRKP